MRNPQHIIKADFKNHYKTETRKTATERTFVTAMYNTFINKSSGCYQETTKELSFDNAETDYNSYSFVYDIFPDTDITLKNVVQSVSTDIKTGNNQEPFKMDNINEKMKRNGGMCMLEDDNNNKNINDDKINNRNNEFSEMHCRPNQFKYTKQRNVKQENRQPLVNNNNNMQNIINNESHLAQFEKNFSPLNENRLKHAQKQQQLQCHQEQQKQENLHQHEQKHHKRGMHQWTTHQHFQQKTKHHDLLQQCSSSRIPSCHCKLTSLIFINRLITVPILILLGLLATPTMAGYDVCSDVENDLLLACNPSSFDAANFGKLVLTLDPKDATCGTPSKTYQRLGDRANTVYTCNAASTTGDAHPLTNIVDTDKNSWWQSVSQTAGTSDLTINITVSFNKLFRLAGNIILTFNSGRPETMVLEKSVDNGATWTPLQFYARNCDLFRDHVDLNAVVTKENPAVVICTNKYVELKSQPRPGGRVTFDLDERSQLFLGPTFTDYASYYDALDNLMLDFLIFSDLRFRFIRPASDGRGNYDEYYYAVQDMNIMARCFCNLHASSCTNGGDKLVCDCKHNTQGVNCEECLPLYNERPWKRGNYMPYNDGTANECKKCECNDHADSCTYDPSYGRGVCNNCTHNTRGKHCEACLESFFPNTTTTINDPKRCLACECNSLGVDEGNMVCAQTAVGLNPIGQCVCKEQVTGRQCDSCIPGFYGLLEEPGLGSCTACECNLDGTKGQSNTCAQSGGQCPCKDSITGRQCDICKDEYYGFPTGKSQEECKPCECNEGGSTSLTCDKATGKCSCKNGIDGDKCDKSAAGSYVPAIDSLREDPAAVSGSCDITSDLLTDGEPFDGTRFAKCDLSTTAATVTFDFPGGMIQAALQWPYYPTIRYTNKNSKTVTGKITLTLQGDTSEPLSPLSKRLGEGVSPGCPGGSPIERDVTLPPGTSTAIVLTDNPITVDGRCKFKVVLALNLLSSRRKRQANQNAQFIQIDSVSLLPALSTSDGSTALTLYTSADDKAAVVKSYQDCLQKVAELSTRNSAMVQAPCDELLFAVVGDIYSGASACSCNTDGSLFSTQCASLGGQCTCKTGVGGRACDRCNEGYFNFTTDGCQECAPLPCPTTPAPPTTTLLIITTTPTFTTTPVPPGGDDDDDDDRLSPLYIVLIVAAVLLFVCGIIFCLYYRRTAKRRRKHVREGVRIMANLGLGDPNSPVYSTDIHQPHYNWVSQKQGVDNPAFVSIPDLPVEDYKDSDGSVFDSKTPTPTQHKPDLYIDSYNKSSDHPRQRSNNTDNKSKTKKEVDDKYKLSPSQVKKSKSGKQGKQFELEKREHRNPGYMDISEFNSPDDMANTPFDRNQSASISDLYAVPKKKKNKVQTKPRSYSLGSDIDSKLDGTMMNQWKPMEDLRMGIGPMSNHLSESPMILSSPELTSFKPIPDNSNKRTRQKSSSGPPPVIYVPTAKVYGRPKQQELQKSKPSSPPVKNGIAPQIYSSIPQKPKRQKLPNGNKNNNNNDYKDKTPLQRQSSRFTKIYPPPPMFGMINPMFIPDPDYSINGDISEPMVYIPKPDYPLYAGYESFDEFNGSLV